MSNSDQIEKFRSRTKGWGLNDDRAWVKVKLGEMRAVLAALDDQAKSPNPQQARRDE